MEAIEAVREKLGTAYSPQSYDRLAKSLAAMGVHDGSQIARHALSEYAEGCKHIGGIQLSMLKDMGARDDLGPRMRREMDRAREGDVLSLRKLVRDLCRMGDFGGLPADDRDGLARDLERLGFDADSVRGLG